MQLKTVKYEKKGNIAYVTLNRPEKGNAMDEQLCRDQLSAWQEVIEDTDIWVAILIGEGKNLCVGADISGGMGKESRVLSPVLTIPGLHYGNLDVYKPIIACIHGYCLGQGMSMVQECDIRLCSEDALMGYPHVSHGFISVGGPTRMPRMAFPGEAMYYLLTGEYITPSEAYRIGLAHKVLSTKDEMLAEAIKIAERICEMSPFAVQCTKNSYHRQFSLPIHTGFAIAREWAHKASGSEDAQEGVKAMFEKRKPVWKNR